MIAQQGHLYPVYISHAQMPGDFAVTIIGDPDAPPGDAQVHVVYPDRARALGAQDYVLLLRCFAGHLLAHADRYEAAQACGRCQERRAMNEREARYARFRAEHDQLEAALADACAHEDDEAAVDAFWEATQQGHFILCPDSCPRVGCQRGELNLGWPLKYFYARVRYGDERGYLQRVAAQAAEGGPCLCCHVAPGQWHHVGCLFEMCPYCGSWLTLACKGEHCADIARERTPPDLAEYLSRPGTLAYLESLRAEPGMDPATMDMVIALARVFAPHQDDDAAHKTTAEEEANDP